MCGRGNNDSDATRRMHQCTGLVRMLHNICDRWNEAQVWYKVTITLCQYRCHDVNVVNRCISRSNAIYSNVYD